MSSSSSNSDEDDEDGSPAGSARIVSEERNDLSTKLDVKVGR